MALHTETLTTAWYELTDLDDEMFVMAITVGDDVDVAIDVAEPVAGATSFSISAGITRLDIPDGKSLWMRCPTGTCDLTYSKFGGLIMDRTKCAYAWQNVTTSAEDVVAGNTDVIVGDDNTGDDPINYVGFLQTVAAGISGAATIDSAVLQLRLSLFRPGQVLRVYGVAEPTSQFSTLLTYADLADEAEISLTTEFVDITIGYTGAVAVDITDLLQELVDLSGWDATSPIQFQVKETTGFSAAEDYRITIFTDWKLTAVFAAVS
jgi:hypothetical protein